MNRNSHDLGGNRQNHSAAGVGSEGNLTSGTDEEGRLTLFEYDKQIRLTDIYKTVDGVESNTHNDYNPAGNLRYVTDARGYRIEHSYNKRNLLESTIYPATEDFPEAIVHKSYDGARNLKTETDEEQKTTSYTYDRENRRTSVEFAGETTINRYDEVGNPTEVIKPEGNIRTMEYDGLRRLTSVTEGGLTTRFEYDGNNNQRHQYDARDNHVEYTWDELNRKMEHIRHKSDGNLVTRFAEYDAEGNLKKLIDPKGQEFTYDYDKLNRKIDEYLPTAATPYLTLTRVHTDYDGNNNVETVTETKTDTGGATVTDTTTNTYDDFDRLKTSTTRGVIVTYNYDSNGNRTGVSTASGSTTYTFDARNRVKTAVAGGTTTFDYYPDGKQKTVSYPNGAGIAYTYYPTDRVKTVINSGAGSATLSQFVYEYDKNGNRTRQEEAREGFSETTTYSYDTLDRMQSFTVVNGENTAITDYTFEGYNRKTETVRQNGSTVTAKSYDYDETDWLTSVQVSEAGVNKTINYTYDKNGNTVRKMDSTETEPVLFDYDASNQLVKAMKGTTLLGLYDYNSEGLRIRHRNSERGDVDYWYDGRAVLEERKNGNLLAHYRYAGKLLSLLNGGELQYYHFDALGSTVNLTNAIGFQQAGYFLDPWGHVKGQEGESVNRLIFTGQEHDENTGLIYFGARYYDPDVARFITEDSYLGEQGTPPSLNRYLYAYSNPTVYIDLEGYESVVPYMVDPKLNNTQRKIFNRGQVFDLLQKHPERFVDELHKDELKILDNIEALRNSKQKYLGRMVRYTVEDLSGRELQLAKEKFGNSDNAALYYTRWKNRDLISRFFFLNSAPFRAFLEGGYDLARIMNPVHEVGDASYRAITGKHMLSGKPVSREEAATEFVFMFTAYKLAKLGMEARGAISTTSRTGGGNPSESGVVGTVKAANKISKTRVGQWMTKQEYEQFVNTGIIPRSNVLTKGKEGYMSRAKSGEYYVEFDVDSSLLFKKDEKLGWWLIKSKNLTHIQKAVNNGIKLPAPIGENIRHVTTK